MNKELREAKLDGATPVKNSGRGVLKGDAVLGPCLIDYKHYTSSFTVSRDNWLKHQRDAQKDGHEMASFILVLESPETGERVKLAVIDFEWFKYFLEEYMDNG